MKPRDFAILVLVCFFWGGNFVVSAWALGNNPVPPFMLATTRAFLVLLCLAPVLLWPLPKSFGLLILICALIGPVHLGFLYTGLQTASATSSSIVAQLFIPISTVLSVVFLRERVGWVRGLAIFGAFAGVIIMILEPSSFQVELGLIYTLLAYVSLAAASILMKKVGEVPWQQFVVWMAVTVFCSSAVTSAIFETGHVTVWRESKWPLLITAGFAAIGVSIIAHGQYFNLLKRYDVSQVVPLTLLTPVFATVLGVLILGEAILTRYWIGAALILPCVYIIAARSER